MFSAYDIKKILPRAVFALVGISLSWALMNIFINMIGFLGGSIERIIIDSFSAASSKLTSINLDTNSTGWFAGIAGVAVAGAAIGLLPVLGLAMTGATGIAIAFGIILLRRVALVGLVVLAPLAIAMSVLPQTEKIFKEWWEWFSKLLLMYPFLMAMFAFSRVAAGIFSLTGDEGASNVLLKFAAIAILIAPYFLVGKIFTLAGGTIAKLAGAVNNRDKGLIDRTKKWEAGKVAERRADAKAGSRYSDRLGTRTINRALGLGAARGSGARAQDAFNKRLSTLKDTNPDIESLSGEEARLLAEAQGSESKMKNAVEDYAQELFRTNKASNITQARVMAKAAAESAKRKAGGVSAASSAYALQKAVESGSITNGMIIERLSKGIGATALGGSQGASYGAQLASGAKGAAMKKAQETLNMQTQAINAAEEAGNFELADKIRSEAGYEFNRDPVTGKVSMQVGSKGTAATLKELGMSWKPGDNEGDLNLKGPAKFDDAGRSRTRPDAPAPGAAPGAGAGARFSVGDRVRSKTRKINGTVTGIAADGSPLVTYEVNGNPITYTKPENLEHR